MNSLAIHTRLVSKAILSVKNVMENGRMTLEFLCLSFNYALISCYAKTISNEKVKSLFRTTQTYCQSLSNVNPTYEHIFRICSNEVKKGSKYILYNLLRRSILLHINTILSCLLEVNTDVALRQMLAGLIFFARPFYEEIHWEKSDECLLWAIASEVSSNTAQKGAL